MSINTIRILFVVVIILGIFLRIYQLEQNLSGFFCDEASIGYNAYSILKTGADEYGNHLPVFFEAFGDYRPGVFVYATVPFIYFLGLQETAVRFTSVTFGVLTVVLMYFLGKEIDTRHRPLSGLMGAAFAATTPWLIHYSRMGFEFSSYVAFFCFTLLLLLFSRKKILFLLLAMISAGIGLYTYQPAKLMIPLLVAGFLFHNRTWYKTHKIFLYFSLGILGILSYPLLTSFIDGRAFSRFNQISIFSNHVSPIQSVLIFMKNYIFLLSPSFFLQGEPTPITRHLTNGLLPLLISMVPFFYLGIIQILRTLKKNDTAQLLLFLLILYPIGGAITAVAPFSSRAIIGAPIIILIIVYGITMSVSYIKKNIFPRIPIILTICIFLVNIISFSQFYFIVYPNNSYNFLGWQYGAKDIVEYFRAHEDEYDHIIMSPKDFNAPDIFFKFYAPDWQCSNCIFDTPKTSYHANFRQLFEVTPEYMSKHNEYLYTIKQIFHYPNGKISFLLVEIAEK